MTKDTEKRPVGRPSDFSAELAVTICARLAEGESLRSICRDEAMPASSTVFLWLAAHVVFSEQYARAREAQADALFEETLEIADDASRDTKWVGREGEEREVTDYEVVARSRLRVDTRKWVASKLAPKKYGDKIEHELGKLTVEIVDTWAKPPR